MHWQPLVDQLRPPGFPDAWRDVQCIESHDEVYRGRSERIAALSGGGNSRTWYATSRSRVATGILLTAPGIPMVLMGEEFYEDKQWSDSATDSLIYWDGLNADRAMIDFHRFTRELIAWAETPRFARRGDCDHPMDDQQPVSRLPTLDPRHGRYAVVVASLNEGTLVRVQNPLPYQAIGIEVLQQRRVRKTG